MAEDVKTDKSNRKLLVTTALEETWGGDEPIVFLGEWCRRYDRKGVWMKRSFQMVSNPWDDRGKLKQDYDGYLRSLHHSLLEDLANAMNRYHRIERSLRYWRMILDPWLFSYLSVLWDRWECLRLAFEEHGQLQTMVFEPGAEPQGSFDYRDFARKLDDDAWNHDLFAEMIEANFSEQCMVKPLPARPPSRAATTASPSRKPVAKASIRYKLAGFIDGLLGCLPFQNRVVFVESYFPNVALLKLNLKLRQVPRLYLKDFEWPKWPTNLEGAGPTRDGIRLESRPGNPFEAFLLNRIVRDIPYVYVEGFLALRGRVGKIRMQPRMILTANAHWANELFKLWSAEQVSKGSKLVVIQHGGSINMGSMMCLDYEEDISDSYATCGEPKHPRHVKLPAVKLVDFKVNTDKSFALLIGLELPRYTLRIGATPLAGQMLIQYDQSITFYHSLDRTVRQQLRVKPYKNVGWNTRNRYIDDLGADKLIEGLSYSEALARARILICTYPQTTFAEAMASGVPTLLLYPERLWELHPDMESLLKVLMAAKIVFHDPHEAAVHLNAIWDDLDQWWDSPNVVSARNEFHRQAVYLGTDWLEEWSAFIRESCTSLDASQ